MDDLSQSFEELKDMIGVLNSTIDILKVENEYLKNNNELFHEENTYLKIKAIDPRKKIIEFSTNH